MEWYWLLLGCSVVLVEAIILAFFISQFSERRFRSRWINIASILVIFMITAVCNYLFVFPMEARMFLYFACGVAYGFLVCKGSFVSRLLLPAILEALILAAEVLAMGVLRFAFYRNAIRLAEDSQFMLFCTIVSKVLLIIFAYFAGRFSKKEDQRIPLGYSLCLLLVPVITIASMIAVGKNIFDSSGGAANSLWFTFSAMGLLFLNLLIIYLFEALMNYSRNHNRLQLMVQQAEMLNNHLRETNALQEETQKIWHDMKNHFTVIQWMVKSRNFEKLEQYMQTLNETVASSMPKFQSGNPILDALLNSKAVEAKKCGVELTVNAAVPQKLSIDDLDLNVVFSNALDNAIEACKKLPEGMDRLVSVDALIRNDHLVLTVKNPYAGEIIRSGGLLQTTKKEAGHGIGMGNMKRAVEKYDGHILAEFEDKLFILSAIMCIKA